jgi:hypothetical protein
MAHHFAWTRAAIAVVACSLAACAGLLGLDEVSYRAAGAPDGSLDGDAGANGDADCSFTCVGVDAAFCADFDEGGIDAGWEALLQSGTGASISLVPRCNGSALHAKVTNVGDAGAKAHLEQTIDRSVASSVSAELVLDVKQTSPSQYVEALMLVGYADDGGSAWTAYLALEDSDLLLHVTNNSPVRATLGSGPHRIRITLAQSTVELVVDGTRKDGGALPDIAAERFDVLAGNVFVSNTQAAEFDLDDLVVVAR